MGTRQKRFVPRLKEDLFDWRTYQTTTNSMTETDSLTSVTGCSHSQALRFAVLTSVLSTAPYCSHTATVTEIGIPRPDRIVYTVVLIVISTVHDHETLCVLLRTSYRHTKWYSAYRSQPCESVIPENSHTAVGVVKPGQHRSATHWSSLVNKVTSTQSTLEPRFGKSFTCLSSGMYWLGMASHIHVY